MTEKAKFSAIRWYFILADCEGKTLDEGETQRFEVQFEVTNDGGQFSEEEDGMIAFYISALIVFAGVLGAHAYKYINEIIEFDMVESPMLILMMSLTMHIAHIVFQLIHLSMYASNGKGVYILDVISTIQLIISQVTIAFLLCMIGWGWTITRKKLDMQDLDLTLPIAAFVVIIHFIAGALIFIDSDEHHKNHDYQGLQGLLLCIFRVCLYIAFLYGVKKTRCIVKDKRKLLFLKFLTISATLYFLSLPTYVFLCQFIEPYNQHAFILFATFFTQFIAYIILIQQFTGQKTIYYGASYKGEDVLPQSFNKQHMRKD